MAKNVLFILARYPAISGGIEKVTSCLANQFQLCDINVYIISYYKDEFADYVDFKYETFLFPDGISVPTSLRNIHFVQDLVRKNNIKYVIYQDSYAPIEGILVYLKPFCKIIVVEHNQPNALIVDKIAEFKEQKINSARSFLRKLLFPLIYIKNVYQVKKHHQRVYELADKYVVLASAYVSDVIKMIGKDQQSKIVVINNPVTINSDKINFDEKRKEVLFVGRLESQKGIDFMLEIWKNFVKKNNDWYLRVIGDGSLMPFIKKRIVKEHISNVFLEGSHSDVTSFYKNSSLVCMTSRYEGWGLVLVEGMLYGNVVFAFDSYGAVFDIIDNGLNGYIIPSYDLKKYSSLLSLIANDVKKRKIMGKYAIDKALLFDINSITKKWLDLLH